MKLSAGFLFYRIKDAIPEYFLVHPGGPFWQKKDTGSWSIPKGEIEQDENPFLAAKREVAEETGIEITIPIQDFIQLNEVIQNPGKKVIAWAAKTDLNFDNIKSNLFNMEWPPKSGNIHSFSEVDKGGWFTFEEARKKILAGQTPLLEELNEKIINSL
ncbi:MAG: NUDIX domain-containing protein [Ginsengibacter sp.]